MTIFHVKSFALKILEFPCKAFVQTFTAKNGGSLSNTSARLAKLYSYEIM